MADILTTSSFRIQEDLFEAMSTPGKHVRGILIEAGQSLNGPVYTTQALQQAAPLFEGKKIFIDHPRPEDDKLPRSMHDLFGTIDKVDYRNNRLEGSLTITEAHPWITKIIEEGIGGDLSIRAEGFVRPNEAGMMMVESIDFVKSVDLVAEGAAGGRLMQIYEAYQQSLTPNPSPMSQPTLSVEALEAKFEEAYKKQLALQEAKAAIEKETTVLMEANATLTKEVTDLKAELAKRDGEAAEAKKTAMIESLCANSGLDTNIVTPLKAGFVHLDEAQITATLDAIKANLAEAKVTMPGNVNLDEAKPTEANTKQDVLRSSLGITSVMVEAAQKMKA